jgi:ferredoxin
MGRDVRAKNEFTLPPCIQPARRARFRRRGNGPDSGLAACIIERMSLKILDTCVNCDVCEPACPNKAISLGEEFYVIDPDLCTECIGHHDEPQCVVVCPVECIITDPENVESHEQLDLKYRHLMAKESAA